MKKYIVLFLIFFIFGCSEKREEKFSSYKEFGKKISMITYKDFRSLPRDELKKHYFEYISSLSGMKENDFALCNDASFFGSPEELTSIQHNVEFLGDYNWNWSLEEIDVLLKLKNNVPFLIHNDARNRLFGILMSVSQTKVDLIEKYKILKKFPDEVKLSDPIYDFYKLKYNNGKIIFSFSPEFYKGGAIELIPDVSSDNISWNCFVSKNFAEIVPLGCSLKGPL